MPVRCTDPVLVTWSFLSSAMVTSMFAPVFAYSNKSFQCGVMCAVALLSISHPAD
ncbi:hypothetical protein PR001_g8136 [Phytophthora rubi]|uniref:Uncharacterized protein n=1 Tax=Phytophthora rubi TaxID=129364 RepID=A0A6A3MXV6_9STRA|nr:hypothetical protein PR001_g8136 [Phytophthora rubi]KAE9046293.1 hypothetical protein PR002_g1735 [Phytophthora rubi]